MKRLFSAAWLICLAIGCGEASSQRLMKAAPVPVAVLTEGPPASRLAKKEEATALSQPPAEAIPRKIIYTGGIDVRVGDLSEATSALDDLVKQHRGFVAQSQINTNPGVPRSGSWRVRVPVDQFTGFVNQVARLGEVLNNKTDSDDVTDRYFDFQVRIENKKVQVDRLQKIIKEQAGKLSEVLEAERELGRVTTELEELKGTVRLWENQSALATMNITMQERSRYVAPEAPSFAKNVTHTFANSLEAVITFAQTLALIVVACTPWLPVIALVAIPSWLVLRRARGATKLSP